MERDYSQDTYFFIQLYIVYIYTILLPYIANRSRWKRFVIGKLSWLDGDLAWPRPTTQAISLEKIRDTDRSTKPAILFHLKRFAIHSIYSLLAHLQT